MSNETHTIVSNKTYILVLLFLLTMTGISVAATQIQLDSLTIFVALFLASVKSFVVLTYFMHLKFDSLFIKLMVASMFIIITLVMILMFIDYDFR